MEENLAHHENVVYNDAEKAHSHAAALTDSIKHGLSAAQDGVAVVAKEVKDVTASSASKLSKIGTSVKETGKNVWNAVRGKTSMYSRIKESLKANTNATIEKMKKNPGKTAAIVAATAAAVIAVVVCVKKYKAKRVKVA